ncbi:MAG: hypothetical protein QW063_02680, partial [Candidatus Nanoarchaeia archaeon]
MRPQLKLIALLLVLIIGFLSLKPFTGYFAANGANWEKVQQIIVTADQQQVIQHITFGNYKTQNCADNIYVATSNGAPIKFRTANEVYNSNNLCIETDVIFDNIIYKPSEPFFGTTEQQSITYVIYYGKIVKSLASAEKEAFETRTAFQIQPTNENGYFRTTGYTFTSVQSGQWTDPATWDQGSGYPQEGDTAIISNGHTIMLNESIATGQLIINSGGILNTSGYAFSVSNTTNISGTLFPHTSTLTFNGNVTINAGGLLGENKSYILDVNAPLFVYGNLSAPNASGTWYQSGNVIFYSGSTLSHNNGVYIADGDHYFDEKITGDLFLYDVIISDGVTWYGTAYEQPHVYNLTIGTNTGATLILTNNYLYLHGNLYINGNSNMTGTGSLVISGCNVTLPAYEKYINLILWSPCNTSFAGNSTANNILIYGWGGANAIVTVDIGSNRLKINNKLFMGHVGTSQTRLLVSSGGNITIGENLTIGNVSTSIFGSNVPYYLTVSGNIDANNTFNAPAAGGLFTFSGQLFNNFRTFNHNGGTIIFNRGSTQQVNGTLNFSTVNITNGSQITNNAGITTTADIVNFLNGSWTNFNLNDGKNTSIYIQAVNTTRYK